MSQPALIGLDWGTTSFRAYLIDAAGGILERREAAAGILQIADRAFEGRLRQEVGSWLEAAPGLPIVASGMIGSRQGWLEAPYAACPGGAADLVSALTRHEMADGAKIHFVPGMSIRGADGIPDVMRGEETQVLGVLALQPGMRLIVLPGTHSKWVRVEGERIEWFATFMTGELFGVLRQHSILGRLMEGDAVDPAAFERGVRLGLSPDPAAGGLLRRLFSARTLGLMGDLPPTGIADYLSGLLLGAELREALGCVGDAVRQGVVIVGGAGLAARYRQALGMAGVACEMFEGEAAATGQTAIARAAGLLG